MCYSQKSFWKGKKSFKGGAFDKIPQLIFKVLPLGWEVPSVDQQCSITTSIKHTPLDSSASWDIAHILFGEQGITPPVRCWFLQNHSAQEYILKNQKRRLYQETCHYNHLKIQSKNQFRFNICPNNYSINFCSHLILFSFQNWPLR